MKPLINKGSASRSELRNASRSPRFDSIIGPSASASKGLLYVGHRVPRVKVEFRNDKTTYWDRLSISFNNVNK